VHSAWGRGVLIPAISILAFLAVLIPVVAALLLAYRQSYAAEQEKAQSLALEVLRRVDAKRDQLAHAFADLQKPGGPPCSPAESRRMAGIVLHYEQLQGAGYLRGNHLICTSAGLLSKPIDLGPPQFTPPNGFETRTGVKLPFAPDVGLVVLTVKSGFALFVHPKLTTDVPLHDDREGVGVAVLSTGLLINRRGPVDAALLGPYFQTGQRAYVVGNHLVAVTPSRTGAYAAFAMLPMDDVNSGLARYLIFLLPIGLICGGLLVLLLRIVVRVESAFAAKVKRAFKADQFYLQYQPVVDLETGRWVGAEALVRWRGANGEMRPDLFIPLMEEAGLIQALTDRVFALLAKEAGPDLRRRDDFYVAVNVAPLDLRGERLAGLIDGFLAATGCSPCQIAIEATERGLIDAGDGKQALAAVRARGVRVAVDDFGTGYSSLSYLQTFPLDCIKIDKSFVDAMGTQAATSSVVTHIINMARDLQLVLVAEGVETEAQECFLRERGVAYGQGWKFAKAMPWDQLVRQLDRQDLRLTANRPNSAPAGASRSVFVPVP